MNGTLQLQTMNETLPSQIMFGILSKDITNWTVPPQIKNGTLPSQIDHENKMSDLALGTVYYLKVLVFIFGCFGNLCSIGIWLTKQFRQTARSTICIVLAFANTAFLILMMGESTTLYFNGFTLFDNLYTSNISCRIKSALFAVSRQMDSWLILLLSVERLFAVVTPYIVKIVFDRCKTAIYVLVITLLILVFNIVILMYSSSLDMLSTDKQTCIVAKIDPTILFPQMLMAQIPLLFIIPLNLVISIRTIIQHRHIRHTIAVTQQQMHKKKSLKVTVSTLSIALTHIILVLPITIFVICCRENNSQYIDAMTVMPMANAGINFYCYTISSREYRRRLMIALGKLRNHVFTCLGDCLTPCLQTNNAVAPEVELANFGEDQYLPSVCD